MLVHDYVVLHTSAGQNVTCSHFLLHSTNFFLFFKYMWCGMCVTCMCVWLHVRTWVGPCIWMYAHMCMCGYGDLKLTLDVLLNCFLPLLLRHGLWLTGGSQVLATPRSPVCPGVTLVCVFPAFCWDSRQPPCLLSIYECPGESQGWSAH